MIAAADACRPLMAALLDKLRCGPILRIDETTVQVLKEPERANTRHQLRVGGARRPA